MSELATLKLLMFSISPPTYSVIYAEKYAQSINPVFEKFQCLFGRAFNIYTYYIYLELHSLTVVMLFRYTFV